MSNDALIERFYGALAKGDGDGCAACYAPDARFSDPVFRDLRGKEPGEMWRMLAKRAKDMRIELRAHAAEGDTGTAHWVATYTFSQTGRSVLNDIHATFTFADGLIATHTDRFDLYKWARQAFGPAGLLLGWSPPMQNAIRKKARAGLDAFMRPKD